MKHSTHTEQNKKALRDALVNNCHGSADNMTISALCQLAGVSRASFYNYYEGIHSIIEEIEQELLEPLLHQETGAHQSDIVNSVTVILQNKREWLFLMNNGKTRQIITDDVRSVMHHNLTARNCILPADILEIFTLTLVPSVIELLIHFLSSNNTITIADLSILLDLMEQSTYDMVIKYMNRNK